MGATTQKQIIKRIKDELCRLTDKTHRFHPQNENAVFLPLDIYIQSNKKATQHSNSLTKIINKKNLKSLHNSNQCSNFASLFEKRHPKCHFETAVRDVAQSG